MSDVSVTRSGRVLQFLLFGIAWLAHHRPVVMTAGRRAWLEDQSLALEQHLDELARPRRRGGPRIGGGSMTTRTHIRVWDEELGCHMPAHVEIPEAVQGEDGRWRVDGPGWALELTGDIPAEQAERICRRAAEATMGPGYRAVAETGDSVS